MNKEPNWEEDLLQQLQKLPTPKIKETTRQEIFREIDKENQQLMIKYGRLKKLKRYSTIIAASLVVVVLSTLIFTNQGKDIIHFTWDKLTFGGVEKVVIPDEEREAEDVQEDVIQHKYTEQELDGIIDKLLNEIIIIDEDYDYDTSYFRSMYTNHQKNRVIIGLRDIDEEYVQFILSQLTEYEQGMIEFEAVGPFITDDPGIIGYVTDISEDGILVVSTEAERISSNNDNYYDAIRFRNAPPEIAVGDKVKVWYGTVLLSYPGQSSVEFIDVIPSEHPIGAQLTKGEAIAKALEELDNHPVLAFTSIDYNQDTEIWSIEYFDTFTEELKSMEISD